MYKKYILIISTISLLLISIGVSFAYLKPTVVGEGVTMSVATKNIQISYSPNQEINGSNLTNGWEVTKVVTIVNNTSSTFQYNIVIKDLVNTFIETDTLKYSISKSVAFNNNNTNTTVVSSKSVPKSSTATDKNLLYEESIGSGATVTYTITFWYTGSGESGKVFTGKIAVYKKTAFPTTTITFNMNGGKNGTVSTTATYDSPMPSITAPTRSGYTFNGYFDATSGGNKYYNADATSANIWDKNDSISTLYAQWTANTYTIKFNVDGGSGGQSASVIATYGQAMPTIDTSAPTKPGYTFGGWYYSSTQYYKADGTSARKWNRASNTTLKAKWIPIYLVDKLLEVNPSRATRTDFSSTLTSSNTGKLYTTTNTEDGSTVYYFAGNAQNNWVKFGKCTSSSWSCTLGEDLYWRIIRTNEDIEDGGIRLLYSGSGSTSNENAYIYGTEWYDTTKNDPMYSGYMWGTTGSLTNNRTNQVNKSNPAIKISSWYTDTFNTSSDSNSKDASGNLYHNYISKTAIYCNDRSIGEGTYNKESSIFYYGARTRLYTNNAPSYACGANSNGYGSYYEGGTTGNIADKFTGSVTNSAGITIGNGLLGNSPAALMTADEIVFAGGKAGSNAKTWCIYNSSKDNITGNKTWWTMSPFNWNNDGSTSLYNYARVYSVSMLMLYPGRLSNSAVDESERVRPVISFKSTVLWASGDGSPEQPFEVILS